MFLKLIESRRARAVAGWALVASVGIHVTGLGTWVREQAMGDDGVGSAREGPISIRYLLPLDHVERAVGERIQWVAPGVGASGFQVASGAPSGGRRDVGDQPPPEAKQPVAPTLGDTPDRTLLYTSEDVDSAATRDPASEGPRYPDALRAKGVQGEVLVEFAVDTTGKADPSTFTVVETSHPLFADAVREALPGMRFTPAIARGHHVRQLVRLPMKFRLVTEDKLTI